MAETYKPIYVSTKWHAKAQRLAKAQRRTLKATLEDLIANAEAPKPAALANTDSIHK